MFIFKQKSELVIKNKINNRGIKGFASTCAAQILLPISIIKVGFFHNNLNMVLLSNTTNHARGNFEELRKIG